MSARALDWLLARRWRFSLLAVLAVPILFGLAEVLWAWVRLDAPPPEASLSFESVSLTLDEESFELIEGRYLPAAVLRLEGNAKRLKYGSCTACTPEDLTGVSLREKNPAKSLSLSNMTWTALECGSTVLTLGRPDSDLKMSVGSSDAACAPKLTLVMASTQAQLSFNLASEIKQAEPAPGSTMTWTPDGAVAIALEDDTEGALLSRAALGGFKGLIGRLQEPLPRLAGASSQQVCKAAGGDVVSLDGGGWELKKLEVNRSGVSVSVRSKGSDLVHCTKGSHKGERPPRCLGPQSACAPAWEELLASQNLTPISFAMFLVGLLGVPAAFESLRRKMIRRRRLRARRARPVDGA